MPPKLRDFVLDNAAPSVEFTDLSPARWLIPRGRAWCKIVLLDWQCWYGAAVVHSDTGLQKRSRTIDILEVSEKHLEDRFCFGQQKRCCWQTEVLSAT